MNPRTFALAPVFRGSKSFRTFAVHAAIGILSAIPAFGSVITWTDYDTFYNSGGDGDGNYDVWSDPDNWSTGNEPTSTDTVVFNTGIYDPDDPEAGGINAVLIDSSGLEAGNIFFDTNAFLSTSGTEVGYSVLEYGSDTYALTLGTSGTIGILSTFAGTGVTQTIAVPLLLSGSATFSNYAPGNTLALTGSIAGTVASGTSIITLSGDGLGTISGAITNGTYGGSVGVLDNSTSTWTLSNNNAYSGGTTVTSGTLIESGSNNFGAGGITVNNATAMFAGNNTSSAGSVAVDNATATFEGNNSFGTGGIAITGGTATFAGATSFGGGISLNGGVLTLSSASNSISGSNGVVVNGGILTLAGNNTFTGGISVTSGTLSISAAANVNAPNNTISLSGGGAFEMTADFTLSSNIVLGVGGGVFTTSGALPTPTYPFLTGAVTGEGGMTAAGGDVIDYGSATWNVGTLTITGSGTRFLMDGAGTQNALDNNATVNVINGGELDFGMTGSLAPVNIMNFASGTYLVGRGTAVTMNTAYAAFPSAGTMNFGSDDEGGGSFSINGAWPTLTGPLTLNYSEGGGATPVTFNSTFNLGSNTLTVGFVDNPFETSLVGSTMTFAGVISGSGGIDINGGTTILSATNTYSGPTTINAGILKISGTGDLGNSSSIVLNGGTLDSSANNYSLAQAITLTAASTIQVETGAFTISTNIATGSSVLTLTGSSGITVSGAVSGAGGIAKSGTGILIVSGNNTYTGATTISGAGTLQLGTAGAFGNGTSNTSGVKETVTGASLDLDGFTPTAVVGLALDGTGSGANSGALTDSSATPVTWGGVVTLAAASSVGGDAGNITLSGGGAGASVLTKVGTDTLILSGNLPFTFTGGLTINNGTVQDATTSDQYALGSGVITFGTANTPTIDLDGNNATTGLLSGSANALVTDSVAASNTLTLAGAGSSTFQGVIQNGSGTVSLTLLSGTQTLSGTNSYTGNTTIDGGSLILDTGSNATGNVLSSSSMFVMNKGTLELIGRSTGTPSQTLGGLTVDGAAEVAVDNLVTGGTTTLNLSGTSGLLGITRATGGTVDFEAVSGTLGTNAIVETDQQNDATGILGAWATVNGGMNLAGNAQSSGTGAIVPYSGYTPVNTNTLSNGAATNVQISSAVTTGTLTLGSATTSINTLMQNQSTAVVVNDAGDILDLGAGTASGVGAILITGSASTTGTLQIGISAGSGTLTSGSAGTWGGGVGIQGTQGESGELILNNNSSSYLIVDSVIANSMNSQLALTITGSGAGAVVNGFQPSVILSAANTYTGPTTITNGLVQVSTDTGGSANAYTSFGTALAGIAGSAPPLVSAGNTITLNGGGIYLTQGSVELAQNLVIGPAGGSISVYNLYGYISGLLSGNGTFTSIQNGSGGNGGTLVLLNPNNTFTGPITIDDIGYINNSGLFANTLSLGPATTAPIYFATGISDLVSDYGGLVTNRTIEATSTATLRTYSGPLTITGALVGAGTLTTYGNSAYYGIYLDDNGVDFTGGIQNGGGVDVFFTTLGVGNASSVYFSGGYNSAGPGGWAYTGPVSWAYTPSIDSYGSVITLSGNVSGGNTGFAKEGPGLLELDPASQSTWNSAQTISVTGGVLQFDFTNFTGAATNMFTETGLSLSLGGGTLNIVGAPAENTSQTLSGNLTLAAGNDGIALIPAANPAYTTTLTLGGTWTRAADATLLIDLPAGATLASNATAAEVNGIIPYALVQTSTGEGWATVSGSGDIVPYNDEGGAVFATGSSSATTNFTTYGSTYTSGSLSLGSGNVSMNSLAIDTTDNGGNGDFIDQGGAANVLTLTGSAILFRGPYNETIQDGQLGASNTELIVNQVGAGTLTIASTISSGTGSLTLAGTGTTILSGSNTYTGATTINGGMIEAGSSSVAGVSGTYGPFGVNSEVSIANNATAILNLNGYNVSIGSLLGQGASFEPTLTPFTNSSSNMIYGLAGLDSGIELNGGTLTIGALNTVSAYGGTISDGTVTGGGITKVGTNYLYLSGLSTYTGPTTIDNGYLFVSNLANGGLPSAIGASSNAAANLVFAGSGGFGHGTLGYTGTANASTNRNFTILTGSTANFAVAEMNTTLTISGTSTANDANVLIGGDTSGNLFWGTVIFTGTNAYTGTTTIQGGNSQTVLGEGATLSVSYLANGGLPSNIGASSSAASNLVLNDGILQYTGPTVTTNRGFTASNQANAIIVTDSTSNLTFTGGATGSGDLEAYGPGTLTLAGATYTLADVDVIGGTVLINGTLTGNARTENSAEGFGVATLGGSGLISGTVQAFGTVAPGGLNDASTGILTVSGSMQFLGGSTLAIELNGSTAGTGYDQLSVTHAGYVSLSGDNNLELTLAPGFTPAAGSQYTIVLESGTSATPYANAFASLDNVPTNLTQNAVFTTGSNTFEISYRASGTTFDIGAGSGSIMIEDAGTLFWSGAGSATWGTASNFTLDAGGTTPSSAVPSLVNNVAFATGTAANLSTTLGASYTINSLQFLGTGNAAGSPVTIGAGAGGTLTIDAGGYNGNTVGNGITMNAGSAGATISAPVVLGASQTWTNNSANALTVSGVVSGPGMGLTIAGTGAVILTAANTYSGSTTVIGGALELNFNGSGAPGSNILPGAGTLTLAGGTLILNGTSAGGSAQTLASLTLNAGSSVISMISNGGATDTLTFTNGTITANVGGTVDFISPAGTNIVLTGNTSNPFLGLYAFYGTGASETYAGTDASGDVIAATGASEVTDGVNGFTSASTAYAYTSPGALDNETISAATANAAIFNNTSAQVIDINPSSGPGTNTLTMNGFVNIGAGTLTIQSTNGGPGSFEIGSANNLSIGGATSVTISASIGGAAGAGLTDANTGTLTLSGTNIYTGPTSNGSGTLAIGGAGQLDGGNYAANISNQGTFAYDSSASQILSGTISGIGVLTENGAGTLTLSGASTYSGNTTLISGTLVAGASTSGGAGPFGAGALTLNGGTLEDNGTAITLSNALSIGGSVTFASTGSGSLNFSGGTVALTVSPTLTIDNSTTIADAITGSGFGITEAGSGTLTLSGASTYSGNTTLTAGTLVAGASTSGGIGPFGTGTLALDGGTFEDNGTAITLSNALSITGDVTFASTGSGSLNFSGGTVTLTASPTLTVNNMTTIADVISGTGFTKAGTGDLSLTGVNTFTGNIVVTGGTLQVNADNDLGNTANTISLSNGATFLEPETSFSTARNFILGPGGGVLVSTGANSTWPAPTGVISGGGGLTVTNVGAAAGSWYYDLEPDPTSPWNLGTLTITGTNERVDIVNYNAIANNCAIIVNSGAIFDFGGGSYTGTNAITVNSGGALESRSGPITLNTANVAFPSTGSMTIGSDDEGGSSFVVNGSYPTLTGPLTIIISQGPAADPVTFNTPFNLGSNTLTVGFFNVIDYAQSRGTFPVGDAGGWVANSSTFAGIISGSGGLINSGSGATTLSAANTFTGSTVVTSGTLTLANSLALQDSVLNYNNQGGTISFGSLTAATLGGLSGAQALPSNSLTSLTLNTQPSVSSTYTAVLANSGGTLGLTVTGAGTQTLTANETYTGPTNVNSGTLIVSGSITGSTVTVAPGATLASGNNSTSTVGNASHPLTVDGTLSPGGSGGGALTTIGELTTGPLTLGTTGTMATLTMELGGTSAGAYDQIAVTSGSALNLTDVTLQASLVNGYTPATGDLLFLIIDAGSVNGTFADAAGNQIVIGNEEFDVSYTAKFSTDSFTGGDDVALVAVAAVPEPGTWADLLGGIGLLLIFRRFRHSLGNI